MGDMAKCPNCGSTWSMECLMSEPHERPTLPPFPTPPAASAADRAHPEPDFRALAAESIHGGAYRVSEALRAAYNAGLRYKADAEVERRTAAITAQLARAEAEKAELRTMGDAINAIRNSIIGAQNINWSEHIYPLVAALNKAGFEGQPYPEAKAYVGSLIERADKAEARAEEAERKLREAEESPRRSHTRDSSL